MQPRNQWLDVLNNYIIYCGHRILLQILWRKNCSHILVVHFISKWWWDNRKDDIVFLLQVFIHMAFMIHDKVTCMSKISFENVIKINSFQMSLKNDYANDVDKMMCHYINNVVTKLFYDIKNIFYVICNNAMIYKS